MNLFTFQLLILASSLSAFALSIRSGLVPQEVANACPSAQVLSSSTTKIDGQDVVRQVLSCPGGNFTSSLRAIDRTLSSRGLTEYPAIEARSAAECTTPAAECQCGQPVICGCFGETVGPSAADCTALIGSLPVIASITGPTFIIQPGTVHTTSLRSCAISFTNLGETPEEFCWDDLANQANGEMSCMSSPPFSNAVCMAETQRFVFHLGEAV
ncbi:hypothetical protein ACEPAI_9846 [Sanghuangporus weigelae]